jgi:hypothetical protein
MPTSYAYLLSFCQSVFDYCLPCAQACYIVAIALHILFLGQSNVRYGEDLSFSVPAWKSTVYLYDIHNIIFGHGRTCICTAYHIILCNGRLCTEYAMITTRKESAKKHVNAKPSSSPILFPRTPLRSCTQSEHYFLSYNTMNDLVEFLRTHEEAFRRYMALSNILAPNRTALTPITVATAFNRSTQTSAYKRHQTRMDTKRTPERGCAV